MSLLGEIRLSFRTLAKNPGFTAVAVATLALGIGVNATVFTVTNAVLFKGFPLVQGNDRLLYVSNGGCCISYADYEDIRAQAKSFEGMGVTHGIGSVVSDESGFPENINVTEITADTFRLVGQKPVMGRDLKPSDQVPGAAPVAILNYGYWQRRYGRDRTIIGRVMRRNAAATTIIGIMPEGFSFPQRTDVWVPLVETAAVKNRANTDTWFAFGRLAPGVTFQSARVEVESIIQRLETEYPVTDQRAHLVVQNFPQFFIGADASLIYGSMWGAVGFVLLIACANLANLMLARAIGRSREISVRIALGAGRWRIIRQLLIESLMLSGLGGLLGWWIARWGVRAYALAMASKESWLIVDYTMDHRVLGYLIAISIGTGILFGLAPAGRLSKLDVNATLKDGGRGATGGGRGKHLASLLVSGEMALAIVLLAGAGVTIRSFLKIHNANMGVNPDNILIGSVGLPAARYPRPEQQIAFFDGLKTRLETIPGVESATIAGNLPTWRAPRMEYELPGDSPAGARGRPKLPVMTAGPGYFRTMGAQVLAGREFNDHDAASSPAVAIVNQQLASKFWPAKNALGKRLRLFEGTTPGPWLSVVGIASNIIQNDETRQKFDPVVYVPFRQKPAASMWVFARTGVPPAELNSAFRQQVQVLDPNLPIYGPFALLDHLDIYWDSRFYGILFLIFAGVALLLASVGLYTVISQSVGQRTQEIGIRMAIGASAGDIRKLILMQGLLPLAIGLAIGLAASLAVNRLLKSMLVNVSPSDPVTLVVASSVLILAALLGCFIPARRAMRVDPVVALRHE
jgi:putative ABC transport system permease protein